MIDKNQHCVEEGSGPNFVPSPLYQASGCQEIGMLGSGGLKLCLLHVYQASRF